MKRLATLVLLVSGALIGAEILTGFLSDNLFASSLFRLVKIIFLCSFLVIFFPDKSIEE
ncbi:MAG: hypothetical protein ACI33J_12420 [Clostridium sp.]